MTRPPGEDAVFTWIRGQDEAFLVELIPLGDGRDYIILRRQYVKQTFPAALEETERFYRVSSLLPTQRATSDTREPSRLD